MATANFRCTLAESQDARYEVPSGESVDPGEVITLDSTSDVIAVAPVGGNAGEVIAAYTRIPRLAIPLDVPTAGINSGVPVFFDGTEFTLESSGANLCGTTYEPAALGGEVIINFNGAAHLE